jgi:phosphocarrier protein FPr/phosphocarrier protein
LFINSPFKGWVRPLSDSSDAAFAQELLGKGLAIEPLANELYAPCDAVIINIATTSHPITLRTKSDIEILIHIGIDTVGLKGNGFKPIVKVGDVVRSGDKLIIFDMDFVAENAPSLLTPIIVLDNHLNLKILRIDCPVEVGEAIFEIEEMARKETILSGNDKHGLAIQENLILNLPHGIHARPAGNIAQLVRSFDSDITINANGVSARANSVVSLMSLNAKFGDELEIIANGADAKEALSSLIYLIKSGLKEDEAGTDSGTDKNESKPAIKKTEKNPNYIYGVSASNGYAIAPAYIVNEDEGDFTETGTNYNEERSKLDKAIKTVSNNLQNNAALFGGPAKAIALAHIEILQDPEIIATADKFLKDGVSAPAAWKKSSRQQEDIFKLSKSARIQERASDLRDLERQIIQSICGKTVQKSQVPDGKDIILIAEDLLPSQFLALNHKNIKAICTQFGGPTSHVGILAASFGIPMLVAIGEQLSGINNEQLIIVNADSGFVIPSPTQNEIEAAHSTIATNIKNSVLQAKNAQIDCLMADGTRIEIFANLASTEEATKAIENGAEGCGLLRTEFLFMDRETAPNEVEQMQALSSIAKSLDGKPLIVRTLDIGGDKPISYLPFPHEENPALGMRGIRYQLENIELLKTQIRAILKSVPANQCRIMLPMIIDIEEFLAARKVIDDIANECTINSKISVGIMVETPSAALMASNLAREADFLSVGSNDLTQYTLAIDRGNPQLAARADSLHPAVLNLIANAAAGAKLHDKWIGVCGGIASIPLAIPILLGLGITELSVPVSMIRQIKSRVRELNMQDCVAMAQLALKASTAAEVRQILIEANNEIN